MQAPQRGADLGIAQQAYADAVCRAAGEGEGPVVLVGHSLGGVAVSQAAEQCPEGIAALVYVAAFLLRDGEALFGWTQAHPEFATSLLGPNLTVDGEEAVLRVAPEAVREVFMADAAGEDVEGALAHLRPDRLAPNVTPLRVTPERWGRVPRVYVETTADRVIPIAAQRLMVARTPVGRVHSLPASHAPFFSQAEELAALLTAVATGTAAPETDAPAPSAPGPGAPGAGPPHDAAAPRP